MNIERNEELADSIILEYITSIGKEIDHHNETCGFRPIPGSQGTIEPQTKSMKSTMGLAYDLGSILIINAGDHLVCLSRAFSGKQLTIAPWAVARNILEASSKSAWLFDPDITPEDRCNRFYSLHYKGLSEKIKFANETGEKELIDDANKEMEELIRKAKSDRVELIYNSKDKLIGIGEKEQFSTDLARDIFDSAPLFRLFAGVLHSHVWAVVGLGMAYSHTTIDGEKLFENQITIKSIFMLSSFSISVFHHALGRKFDIFGWDRSKIDIQKENSIRHLEETYRLDFSEIGNIITNN